MRVQTPTATIALLLFLASSGMAATGEIPLLLASRHEITASIAPSENAIELVDQVTVRWPRGAKEAALMVHPGLRVGSVTMGDAPLAYRLEEAPPRKTERDEFGLRRLVIGKPREGQEKHRITIALAGKINDPVKVPEYSRGASAEETSGLISEEGTFLRSGGGWYPEGQGLAEFRLTVITPKEVHAIASGRLLMDREKEDEGKGLRKAVFDAPYPLQGLDLMAARYIVTCEPHGGTRPVVAAGTAGDAAKGRGAIQVCTYFFQDDEALERTYLDAVKGYLDLYEGRIGRYPFDRFATVENFFPTGYGMPGWTLLGSQVLRLPFIPKTSLGHEVLHNWWGNGVYVGEGGNWCEGLTAYLADYLYKELESPEAAREHRVELLRSYAASVRPENDFPLTQFSERTTFSTRAIGYNKSAMVFHMLRREVGEDVFWRSIRRFYTSFRFTEASWGTIQSVFERESGKPLGWFFDQWVRRAGAPVLAIADVQVTPLDPASGPDSVRKVTARIEQTGDRFRVTLPVVLRTEGECGGSPKDENEDEPQKGRVEGAVSLIGATAPFQRELRGCRAEAVLLDPDAEVFRRLDPREIPPTVARALGDGKQIVVLPSGGPEDLRGVYRELAAQWTRSGEARAVEDKALTDEEIAGSSLLVLGAPGENAAFQRIGAPGVDAAVRVDGYVLKGAEAKGPGVALLLAAPHPKDPTHVLLVFSGSDAAAVKAAGPKVIHYGKYGYVAFKDGKAGEKGSWPASSSPSVVSLPAR